LGRGIREYVGLSACGTGPDWVCPSLKMRLFALTEDQSVHIRPFIASLHLDFIKSEVKLRVGYSEDAK